MTLAHAPKRTDRRRQPASRQRNVSSSSSTIEPRTLAVVPSWIEAHCVVPDGFRRGEPFTLYDWQLLWYANFYLVRGDAVASMRQPATGSAFVNRRGLLVGPQKLGKNPLIATHVAAEGVGPVLFAGFAGSDDGYACADWGCRCGWEYSYDPGEPMGVRWPTPLIQITAFSEDSTENTYDALRPMIELGPLSAVIPKTGEEFIRLPGGGRIDTVTSSNQSRLGQRTTFVPQDEVGLWTATNKMVKLADTQYRNLSGMGGRAALTSNAWDPVEHSVAQREFESSAGDVYRQFVQPPRNLSYANKADRKKIHRIVYPAEVLRENGGHLDLASVEAEAADLVEKDAPQAARFYGNILTAGAGAAVEPEAWDALAKPREIAAGAYVGLGFDGSIYHDTTSLRACTADGYRFEIAKWERPKGRDMLAWQDANPGKSWSVPRDEVHSAVLWCLFELNVGRFLADPPKWWTEIDEWDEWFGLGSDGKGIVVAFDTNQPRRIAPAFDRWLTGVAEGLPHDGDPSTADHVKALHRRKVRLADQEDDRTMYVPVKGEDGRPIDAAIADILSLEAAMTMPAETPEVLMAWA
jgi:hypothetical protein